MGFVVGASFVAPIGQPNQQSHINTTKPTTDPSGDQHQPAKTFGERLSIIWDRTWEDPVAFYTFVLGVFSFFLVAISVGQGYFLFRADETARISANAAKRSADAIAITERPYIFIWGMVSHKPQISYGPLHEGYPQQVIQVNAAFLYSVSNRGKLTAVIENVMIACGYERNGLPPPLVSIGEHYFLRVPLISSEKDIENIAFEIPWRQLDRFNPNPSPEFRDDLIFRVVVEYRGPFTNSHETSQCWRYRAAVNGWAEDSRFTYSRQRNKRPENT